MSTDKKNKTPSKLGFLNNLNCASGKSKKAKSGPLTMVPPSTPPDMSKSYEDDPEVSHEVITVTATPGHGAETEEEISYTDIKVIGKGTFGVVYRAKLCKTGEMVAMKKVFHNEKFKNRELQMLRLLQHPNVIKLHYFFFSNRPGCRKDELYLNMIMEFIPETLWSIAQCDGTGKPLLELLYVKVYMYQLFRCLVYLHSLGICHRDIKPQNLLLNPETHVIKLCDFGSAKALLKDETNVAYICSRYYRAPELILGATDYTLQIDVWSAGCVLAELLLGQPVFPGATAADQLVEIIKILGTPTVEDFHEINRNYQNFNFPHLRPQNWQKVLTKSTTTDEAVDLVSKVLVYMPSHRMSPIEIIAHPFFNDLRKPQTRLNGKRLPPLFNFTTEELAVRPDMNDYLIPEYYRQLELSGHLDDLETLNIDDHVDAEPADSSLLGKFRSSIKKKVSIKRLSDIVKSPMKHGSKKGAGKHEEHVDAVDAGHEDDDPDEHTDHDDGDERHRGDFSESIDVESHDETNEIAVVEDVQESSVSKKKKKKKKKQKEVADDEPSMEVQLESSPARMTYAAEPADYARGPVDVGDVDSEDLDVSHASMDHSGYAVEGEATVVTKSSRTKKTRRKTPRKSTDEAEEL